MEKNSVYYLVNSFKSCLYSVKVKVKCTLVQALRLCTGRTAHRGSRVIALLFHDHGTRRGWGSASRPGHSLPLGKTRYPLYRRLGGPQGRSGQVRKISPPPGFDPRTIQPVASHYTDSATRPTLFTIDTRKLNKGYISTHWKWTWNLHQYFCIIPLKANLAYKMPHFHIRSMG